MKKAILITLPALYLSACTEPTPPPPPPQKPVTTHHHHVKTEDPNFHAVEKPSTYR
jgi:hypothetical protein